MSEDATVEIDVCYNDFWMEVYTIKYREYNDLLKALYDDNQKSFKIGDKLFFKKELNSVGIAGKGFGFLFMDVND